MKVVLIILSKTNTDAIYKMNCKCISTFIESARFANVNFEILLVESYITQNYKYKYPNFKIITPNLPFNFHQFLNIGIKKTYGDFYVLSNNDVIFSKNWLRVLLDVSKTYSFIESFSPYDSASNKLSKDIILNNEYVCGYEIQKHITGWCLVLKKKVINTIGKLDERFDFYYADFDYSMQLQKYNIKHALLTKAIVNHIESVSYSQENDINYAELPIETPKYLIKENWTWVLKDKKMLEGVIKFHKKWGSRRSIKLKLYMTNLLNKAGLGFFSRFVLISKS